MANTHTHTHTECPSSYTGWMEPRARIGHNLDTCKRCRPPIIKLMSNEHREDAVGGGGSRQGKHTHTHTQCPWSYRGWMEPRARIGHNLDICRRGPPQIKLMGYQHRENAVGGGGAGNSKHTQTQTHTHIHTHTVSTVIHRVD